MISSVASVFLKLCNLTSLPCFHTFFQLHHDQSSSLQSISFFSKNVFVCYFFFVNKVISTYLKYNDCNAR